MRAPLFPVPLCMFSRVRGPSDAFDTSYAGYSITAVTLET